MTSYPDLERRVTDLFADEAPQRAPEWLLHDALAVIDGTPQRRPRLRVPWRFPTANVYMKGAVAAVAVIAIGAVGFGVLRSVQGPGVEPSDGPSPSLEPSVEPSDGPSLEPSVEPSDSPSLEPSVEPSDSPSPSPSPSVEPSPSPSPSSQAGATDLPSSGVLEAGRYTLGDSFSKPITFEVPDGWSACTEDHEIAICGSSTSTAPEISFMVVENLVADPCARTLRDPAVGPTVDDLVAAISLLEGFTATAATEVSLDGYDGKQLELVAPDTGECLLTWATSPVRTNGVAQDEINLIRIFDIDGERVMLAGALGGTEATRPVVEQILDSVHIGQ